MKKEYRLLLICIKAFLEEGKEPDTAMLATKLNGFTNEQIYQLITEMEENDFIEAFEIDMCCAEDYIVKALTKKGEEVISKLEL